MTGNDVAVFHLMDPIAGVGDEAVVRDKKQRFLAFTNQVRQ